ncbi:hypothetical protein AB0I34_43295, partial [Kribbella sp. NPDC050281]|uniref:hypothetical protein n=1 Tax=Kribbella sp. NPDC050281 TaxID=3155515 RepID=UPI0033F61E91
MTVWVLFAAFGSAVTAFTVTVNEPAEPLRFGVAANRAGKSVTVVPLASSPSSQVTLVGPSSSQPGPDGRPKNSTFWSMLPASMVTFTPCAASG